MIFFDIETTGLNPIKDKIITIQIKSGKKTNVWTLWEEMKEMALIEKFLEFLKTVNEPVVGYNINGFDLHFIKSKLAINKKLTDEISNLIDGKKWIDLTEFQQNNYGMDNWIEELGIKRTSNVKGWHVPALYELKMYGKIVDHAIDDLNICEEVVKKMNLKF